MKVEEYGKDNKSVIVMNYPNIVGTPYDYGKRKNWMVLPKKIEKEVDCIWLYPTSSMANKIIGKVDPVMKFMAKSNYKVNGPVFSKHCNMFAPYYHQLSAMKFNELTDDEIFEVEKNEPRTDVYAALDYYFEHYNNGRPYVLAGHSQGACMIVYILTEYMKFHPEYYDRMIAAYVVGYGMTPEQLEANPHIKTAEGSDDTGVLISWNTEGPENIGQHNFVIRPGAYIINPVNWRTDDTPAYGARIDLSRRSIISETADPKKCAIQNEVAARFGPLGKLPPVKKLVWNMMVPGFGSQSFHNFDYAFYADSVSENLKHRIDNYFEAMYDELSAPKKK